MKEPEYDGVNDTLDKLYRQYQQKYIESPFTGTVSVVSNSHIVCSHYKTKQLLTLPELYLSTSEDVKKIRILNSLLPSFAHFYILHYPDSNDVFVIHWNNGRPDNFYSTFLHR